MGSAMNYIELHIGDYLRDTAHLTPKEQGIYFLLLMRYYTNERAIPDEYAHRYAMAPRAEVEPILAEFFERDGEVWRHTRVEAEIEKYRARVEHNRQVGALGGRPKKTRTKPDGLRAGTPNGTRTEPANNPHQTPDTSTGFEVALQPAPAGGSAPGPAASGRTRRPRRTGDGPGKASASVPLSAPTWIAYGAAYRVRYGVDPVRNAKVSGMLCKFVERVGSDAAPAVAEFYVGLNRGLYVSARHAVDLLLRDAEALHTDWQRGQSITDHEARALDRTQTNANAFEPLLRAAREREALPETAADAIPLIPTG